MSPIIRATDRSSDVQGVAFNFDDIAARANVYLDKVRSEAAEILTNARHEAEETRKQAEDEGRRLGKLAVDQMVRDQLAAQLETLLPSLREVIGEIRHAKQAWLTHWEKSGLRVATAIAERLIRSQLKHAPEMPLILIREALEMAAGSTNLRIHISPSDYKTLQPQIEALIQEFTDLGETELVPDPEMTPGESRVDTQFGTIDHRWETQLKRIEEELT
jgi:flagellar biosynthesis/type III secretory pathway protein FliH